MLRRTAKTMLLVILLGSYSHHCTAQQIDSAWMQKVPYIKITDRVSKSTTIIYKGDSLNFQSPHLFTFVRHIPSDMWYIAKSPFQKQNLPGLAVVAASTAILIAYDQ